jgi:hypothetical protein
MFQVATPWIFVTTPLIVFISIVGYLTLTANSGTVEFFDTFGDDRRKRRKKRRKNSHKRRRLSKENRRRSGDEDYEYRRRHKRSGNCMNHLFLPISFAKRLFESVVPKLFQSAKL